MHSFLSYKIFNMSRGKGDKRGESRKVREGELASVVGAVGFPPKPVSSSCWVGARQYFPAPLAGRSSHKTDVQPMAWGEL